MIPQTQPAPAASGPRRRPEEAPDPQRERGRLIEKLQRRLLDFDLPRLQMSLMVAGTGAAGFLFSYWMLRAGLDRMAPRYFLAVGLAYLVFLFFLWLWILLRRARADAGDLLDLLDLAGEIPGGGSPGGGGSFGGGGASASLEGGPTPAQPAVRPPARGGGGGKSGLSLELDLDEFAVLVAVLAAVTAALAVSVWIIVTAPALFAELLIDGALVTGLYRRLKHLEQRHWLETALRRTALSFALVALFAAVAGWAMQSYAPEARSVGGVWQHYQLRHSGNAELPPAAGS